MSKLTSALIGLMISSFMCANTSHAQVSTQFDTKNLDRAIKRFVATPHPMGSEAQKKLARDITSELSHHAWDAKLQAFTTAIPNIASTQFGGKSSAASTSKKMTGENIIAISKGKDRCMVIVGGHYDTKYYPDFTFVGANDGGSSTVLMQEMARVITQVKKQEAGNKTNEEGRFIDCSIALVFFDGEEATLKEWSDAEKAIGLVDNTYGSREFAKNIVRKFEGPTYQNLPIKAVLIVDMIGHKNQQLFITNGSHPALTQKFLGQKTDVLIQAVNLSMEDDHLPFAQLGVPFLHIIDWTNLSEWHNANDNLNIISTQKIANFGEHMLRFLKQKR